jgi:hypothetical protein
MRTLCNVARPRANLLFAIVLIAPGARAAKEDIAFVAEHLPEVAMDNRYANLPLWTQSASSREDDWRFGAGLGYTQLRTGELSLRGPMFTLNAERELADWRLNFFVFRDDLSFSGATEQRPLNEPFVDAPLAMPVAAEFSNLAGTMLDSGAGVSLRRHFDRTWFGALDLSAGLLWQSVQLDSYRLDYRVLEGPDTGASGSIDFSGTYNHIVPFFGIAKSWQYGSWNFSPHAQFALPLPRRGIVGEISGPGFDLAGDSETNGQGKHFGDPSVTLGFDATYSPWNLTIDVGSILSQALVEPLVHQGIDSNWVVHARWEW